MFENTQLEWFMGKNMKVALIVGSTSFIFCTWLMVDFVFYLRRKRRERNIIAENKRRRKEKHVGHDEDEEKSRKMHDDHDKSNGYNLLQLPKRKKTKVGILRFQTH